MIWRAFRHSVSVELIAWAVVIVLVLLLSRVGVGANELGNLNTYAPLGFVLFLGLCLLIYRLRYGRL